MLVGAFIKISSNTLLFKHLQTFVFKHLQTFVFKHLQTFVFKHLKKQAFTKMGTKQYSHIVETFKYSVSPSHENKFKSCIEAIWRVIFKINSEQKVAKQYFIMLNTSFFIFISNIKQKLVKYLWYINNNNNNTYTIVVTKRHKKT